ncbi:MAG: aspartate/glutamate racemase family protein [Gammaproteobacteria bacterium]|nr:aspartate/glutamate racemase family protein [Gammaproteobacteria bacterium]MDP2139989.1 aspartate/glutamate racemase family protein [Gammaproteobacteria bacterium]MDP2347809.1 aspartate/glutamate racemase family protein [Gammaproteobacteria bacterium]
MKTIGLLGGMSWESTTGYYRAINEGVRARLGGLHSAKIVMHSVDFAPLEKLQHAGDWDGAATMLCEAALSVQHGGADFLLICTNTMHKVAAPIEDAIDIPLLHIADATAEELVKHGITRVGLLGTGFTMAEDFYKGRIRDKYGIEVLVPDENDRSLVHRVIYDELCLGKVEDASRQEFLRIIADLSAQSAEAVILGCTEIGMLVGQSDTAVRLFDTTAIHSAKAVDWALSD